MRLRIFTCAITLLLAGFAVVGQTTEFSYQGSLKDGANAANGNYDFEFRVYDAVSGGTQIGSVAARAAVAVGGGIFSVKLDFGSGFPGADRYLEIRVRNAGGSGYTILDPRQKIGSAPYAIKSLTAETATSANTATSATSATFATTAGSATNSSQLGGVPANQYVQTADPRLTDARTPIAGSGSYIQNQNTGPQTLSNFNVSGNGTVGGILSGTFVNASQYNLGGVSLIQASATRNSLTIGLNAGLGGSGSTSNTIVGDGAGASIGSNAYLNSFFGTDAGKSITTGYGNTLIGARAGQFITFGSSNVFLGDGSGGTTSTGQYNTAIGIQAGDSNTTGSKNTFVGLTAGFTNGGGSNNTALGFRANVATPNLNYATAIGSDSVASLPNSIYLGRPGGEDVVRIPGAVLIDGSLVVDTLGTTTGNVHLCRNTANRISLCTSNVPDNGETEALRKRIGEQQEQIGSQQKQIAGQKAMLEKQQTEIDVLKNHICSQTPSAAFCAPRN